MLQPGQWTCKDKRSAYGQPGAGNTAKPPLQGLSPPGVPGTIPEGLGPSSHWGWDVPTQFLAWMSQVQLYLTPTREKHSFCVSFSIKIVFLKHHMQTPSVTVFSLLKTWLIGAKRLGQHSPLTQARESTAPHQTSVRKGPQRPITTHHPKWLCWRQTRLILTVEIKCLNVFYVLYFSVLKVGKNILH